jgi:hypothetical protein
MSYELIRGAAASGADDGFNGRVAEGGVEFFAAGQDGLFVG